jgi:phage N-6-adenine-methyltransferase
MTTTTDPRQEWRTPKNFLEAVQHAFGKITIDVAASAENAVCERYIDRAANGLVQQWFLPDSAGVLSHEVAWCNPGFSSMAKWVEKACYQVDMAHQPRIALVLCLCAPSTVWWRMAIENRAEVRLLAPRVQFDPPPGIPRSSNPRDCALLVFRDKARRWKPDGGPQILMWYWKEQTLGGGYGR